MAEKEKTESEEEKIEKEIKHIENLIYKIDTSAPNHFSINDLPKLVHKEYNRVVDLFQLAQ